MSRSLFDRRSRSPATGKSRHRRGALRALVARLEALEPLMLLSKMWYVESGYGGTQEGTLSQPYTSIGAALGAAAQATRSM